MKMALVTVSLLFSSALFAASKDEALFCKGKNCSEFENYISQIKETYLKMKTLNENCQKNEGQSCAELAVLVKDSEATIKPEFKEENKKFLGKLGISGDAASYDQKACSLKIQSACKR